MKKLSPTILLLFLSILTFWSYSINADQNDPLTGIQLLPNTQNHEAPAENPLVSPKSLVVKIKRDSPFAAILHHLVQKGQACASLTGDTHWDDLVRKYVLVKVTPISPLVAQLKAPLGPITPSYAQYAQRYVNWKSSVNKNKAAYRRGKQLIHPQLYDSSAEFTYRLTFRKKVDQQTFQAFLSDANVRWAEPEVVIQAAGMPPNDPFYSSATFVPADQGGDLWGLKKIQSEEAWTALEEAGLSPGQDVVVAVVDSGIDPNHVDLNDPAAGENHVDPRGRDFVGTSYLNPREDNTPEDAHGHGTHMAGTIAAIGNNGKGIIGVAHKAKILPVKVLDNDGFGTSFTVAQGIRYAADQGAQVINLSFSGINASRLIQEAIDYAYVRGSIVVAAAGNQNRPVLGFQPGGLEHVITVAASDPFDVRTPTSNFGVGLDVAAPGGGPQPPRENRLADRNIVSLLAAGSQFTDPRHGALRLIEPGAPQGSPFLYFRHQGTSSATAHVSGVVALLLTVTPDLDQELVEQILRVSAVKVGGGPCLHPRWDMAVCMP